eukprot:gene34914-23831_t
MRGDACSAAEVLDRDAGCDGAAQTAAAEGAERCIDELLPLTPPRMSCGLEQFAVSAAVSSPSSTRAAPLAGDGGERGAPLLPLGDAANVRGHRHMVIGSRRALWYGILVLLLLLLLLDGGGLSPAAATTPTSPPATQRRCGICTDGTGRHGADEFRNAVAWEAVVWACNAARRGRPRRPTTRKAQAPASAAQLHAAAAH